MILAGGTGTRLFPASTPENPKPLLSLGGERSLLAKTADRVSFADETYVLTRESFVDQIREKVPQAGILTEPEPKDTGPALVYAAARIREQISECVLLCVPSDHAISGDFTRVATEAVRVARATDGLVTIGIEPDHPATGYGYIEPAEPIDANEYAAVERFVEKPDEQRAAQFLQEGYYWNSGIFAWTPEALLRAAKSSPLGSLVAALETGNPTSGFENVDPVSIDTAVLERTTEAYVVPGTFEWADLGSWDSITRVFDADESGTVTIGEATVLDVENSLLATDATVSAIGVSNLVVVSFGGHTVVVPREQATRVSELTGENSCTES